MMRKVLVTGANGMLADAFLPLLRERGCDITATDIVAAPGIARLDIRDKICVEDFICSCKPDIVFHLAAETDVDKCEVDRAHALLTNAKGTEHVALGCRAADAPLVYISSGAVFDGKKSLGYTEQDKPGPVSVYGSSKLQGEDTVKALLKKYFIIRAGWMIGGYNKDKKFVWKIIQLLRTKDEISVVTDKRGSPTFTRDLSRGILAIVDSRKYGTYHCVNKGICTRFEIAQKIAELLDKKNVRIKPVSSAEFPLPAPRADSEALLNHNLSLLGIDVMRPWQDALEEYIKDLP